MEAGFNPPNVTPKQGKVDEIWADEAGDLPQQEVEEEVEVEEASEQEEQEELVPIESPEEAPEEPPQGVSERANKRFRQLAQERNDAYARATAMAEQNQAILGELAQLRQQQGQLYQSAQQAQQAHKERLERAAFEERLRLQGYTPGEFSHDTAVEAHQKASSLESELRAIKESIARNEQAQRVATYRSALTSEFSKTFEKLEVPASFDRTTLEEQAFALAAAYGLTPTQAVGKVMAPLAPFLKARVIQKKKTITPEQKKALEMTSQRGRSGMRDAGSKQSGRPGKKTVEQMERDLGAGADWAD